MDKLNELERSAKCNADNFEPVTVAGTKDILAIAEAFRELEQRVEAAESMNKHLDLAVRKAEGVSEALRRSVEAAASEAEDTDKTMRAYSDQLVKVTADLVAAQAQLAELAKQKPIGVVYHSQRCGFHVGWSDSTRMDAGMELFARPAPAAVPVDLLPDEGELERLYSIYCTPTVGSKNAIRHIRKEMLRRIEGLNK